MVGHAKKGFPFGELAMALLAVAAFVLVSLLLVPEAVNEVVKKVARLFQ